MSDKAEKMFYLKFEPKDWLTDQNLGCVSLAARGLWMHMLSLMFLSDERGYITWSNQPDFLTRLARSASCETDEVSRLLNELEANKVFSRTEDGVVFCRRMVRDDAARRVGQQNGKKGGNPSITRTGGLTPDRVEGVNPSLTMTMTMTDGSGLEGGSGGKPEPTPEVVPWLPSMDETKTVVAEWDRLCRERLRDGAAMFLSSMRDCRGFDFILARLRSEADYAAREPSEFMGWVLGQVRAYWASTQAVARDNEGRSVACTFRGFFSGAGGKPPKALENADAWNMDRKGAASAVAKTTNAARTAAVDQGIEARRRADAEARAEKASARKVLEDRAAAGDKYAQQMLERMNPRESAA